MFPAAPVHLHVIESPLRELQEILIVVAFAAGVRHRRSKVRPVESASGFSCVGVDAGLQSQGVNEPHDVGHVPIALSGLQRGPLLGINGNVALGVARAEPPAFINIDVAVARILHAGRNHGTRLLRHDF